MATILETKGPNGGKRIWIDERTGVRLRAEELNSQGVVTQSSYYTSIDYNLIPTANDFAPGQLPLAPHVAQFPARPPLATIADAQKVASFAIHEPRMPAEYHLTGVWIVPVPGGRQMSIQRYTDGVNTIALFEQPATGKKVLRNDNKPHIRAGVVHWSTTDRVFTLIGSARRESIRTIVDSMH